MTVLVRKGAGKVTNLEMVNEGFHAFLHRSAWRRNQLMIIDLDWTGRNLVQALAKHRGLESPKRYVPLASLVPD